MDELRLNDNGEPSDVAQTASWDEPLLAEDLEQAYQRALEATDAVEREMNSLPQPDANIDHAPANVAAHVASSSDSTRQPTTGLPQASPADLRTLQEPRLRRRLFRAAPW